MTAIRSRHVLETVVSRCIGEGLVGAEGFAVDTCAYRKSSPSILVVQSTQDRTGQNGSATSAARDIGASLFNDK